MLEIYLKIKVIMLIVCIGLMAVSIIWKLWKQYR